LDRSMEKTRVKRQAVQSERRPSSAEQREIVKTRRQILRKEKAEGSKTKNPKSPAV